MKRVSISEFRKRAATIREDLKIEHEIVLTFRARPFAILAQVTEDSLEETHLALVRCRARAALRRMRASAEAAGLDKMTMEQIDALIAKVRRQRKARQ